MLLCTLFCAAIYGWTPVVAQTPKQPQIVHAQTQDGIRVQIEKISLERVFNEPGWLQRYAGEQWKEKLSSTDLDGLLPIRVVTVFVSVSGKAVGYGPAKLEFPNYAPKNRVMGTVISGAPMWKTQVPSVAVDPGATGMQVWHLVGHDARIRDLLPLSLEVQITTEAGNQLTFVFEEIEF
ncbi:MAG: hypothetical protein D6753_08875 [Planctomycetota bacterium]|nr:MAG: hypothetical protein D6753_08875 [Planctomycetota bacterium]